MKKTKRVNIIILPLLIVFILCCVLPTTVFAAQELEISQQPQNYIYPEGSVAIYSIEATGNNLHYTWYIVFDGKTYDTSKLAEEEQPWTNYVSESCGQSPSGNSFFFQGIEDNLTGAEIYCVVEDGDNSVTSERAVITVGGSAFPPNINVPASLYSELGMAADIYCTAESTDGSSLEYLWYETATGNLDNIVAVNRGAETSDTLHCDTSTSGTRYYVCMVTTSTGGKAYSSIIPVTVTGSVPSSGTNDLPDSSDQDIDGITEQNERLQGQSIELIIIVSVVGIILGAVIAIIVMNKKRKKTRRS